MRKGKVDLNIFIENEFYLICPLLNTSQFKSFSGKHNIRISSERLEQLERIGLFYPIARFQPFPIKVKIKKTAKDRYYDLGVLEEGEKWDGETIDDFAMLTFEKDYLIECLLEGHLWDPCERDYLPWDSYKKDMDDCFITESYYSKFQIYELNELLSCLASFNISAEYWYGKNDSDFESLKNRVKEQVNYTAKRCIDKVESSLDIGYISQILSKVYYPYTQTNQRTIRAPIEWESYRKEWNPKEILLLLNISKDDISNACRDIHLEAHHIDPLENWRALVKHIAINEKEKLKDKALLANVFYSMEEMLKLFYKDVTGNSISYNFLTNEDWGKRSYGEDTIENTYLYLEFLCNKYEINPRPKLILFVEGEGEHEQIPRIALKILGHNFLKLGIQIENLEGVSNFTGKKDEFGGKLLKLIEYFHKKPALLFMCRVMDSYGRDNYIVFLNEINFVEILFN